MEDNKQHTVKEIIDLIKGFEQRINKNEQLLMHAFSYLYIRQDELAKYDKNFATIDKSIATTNSRIDNIENTIINLNYQLSSETKKINKKRRPWHYFFSKYFKYKKLCKERKLIHKQIEIELEEKRIKAEQLRKEREEQERLDKIRKAEEEKNAKELKKKQARNKMAAILNNIGKDE